MACPRAVMAGESLVIVCYLHKLARQPTHTLACPHGPLLQHPSGRPDPGPVS